MDYGAFTYQRVVPGAALNAADLVQAQRLRRELAVALNATLRDRHALITPTALGPAPRFDSFSARFPLTTPIQTMPYNVTGNPAMSIPIGFTADAMPLGMQIVGRAFDEATVCRIGAAYEEKAGWTARRPALATQA
jgi:aspartyl-tRNA(Asn)/glutamyl-tRNA(Gln) amidotransferase subunit A